MDNQTIANILVWCVNIIYFVAILPQIFLNHRLRGTAGLSTLMLILYFCAYIAEAYYAICLHLPDGYRFMMPLGVAVVIILFCQKFYFSGMFSDKIALYGFLFVVSIALVALPVARGHGSLVGNVAGWTGALLWSTYKLPQIFKLHKVKSAEGVSMLFFVILLFGGTLEVISALILHLPKQSLFNGVYSVIINSFIVFQIFLYSKKSGSL